MLKPFIEQESLLSGKYKPHIKTFLSLLSQLEGFKMMSVKLNEEDRPFEDEEELFFILNKIVRK